MSTASVTAPKADESSRPKFWNFVEIKIENLLYAVWSARHE